MLGRLVAAAGLLATTVPALGAARADGTTKGSSVGCEVQRKCVVLTPAQLFDLVEQFASTGRVADAERLLHVLVGNRDAEVRAEALFRLGNLRQNTGDPQGAVDAYRALLDQKPNATLVRLELARLLARMGQDDAALSQLRRASTAGLPEDVARAVDRFQLSLRSRRRLGLGLEISIAPDSNINRATADSTTNVGSTVLELSPDARARSGLGFTSAVQGFWRPRLNANTNLLIAANGKADLYGTSRFNDIGVSLAAGPELLRGRSRIRPSALVGGRWIGHRFYSSSQGATLNWLRQLDRTSQIQLDLAAVQTDYRLNPAITGFVTSGVVRYERALSARLFGRLLVRLERQEARDPAYANWSTGGELLLSRELRKLTVYGRAGYYRTWGDAAFTLPPARRRDTLTDLEAGLVFRTLSVAGVAPVVRLHETRNRSPVFLYDFRRTRVEFGVTRDF